MKHYRKKSTLSMQQAIFLLIVGLLVGTVFTFGNAYWHADVPREDCRRIETEFLEYKKIYVKRSFKVKEIAIDCSDGERYFIDGVSVNRELQYDVEMLSEGEWISLLIHPNSNTILEFAAKGRLILDFEDTAEKLGKEKIGFIILGAFFYFFASVGLYHIVAYKFSGKKKIKGKK